MGRKVDLDSPLSEEDKAYLRERGRDYLIPANERRFGVDGTRVPEAHEQAGGSAQSPFYDNDSRQKAVYDVGGAPLPGAVLNHDTGRVLDRDTGMEVEFTGPGHTPGGYNLSQFDNHQEYAPGQADFEDGQPVAQEAGFVEGVALDNSGRPVDDSFDEDITSYVTGLQNKSEVQAELTEHDIAFSKDADRPTLNDKLIIFYQDLRRSGVAVSFEDEDEDESEG